MRTLPACRTAPDTILAEMQRLRERDARWHDGRV